MTMRLASLSLAVLLLAVQPAAANTYEIATGAAQTSSNSGSRSFAYTVLFHPVINFAVYVTIAQSTNYDEIWDQDAYSSVSCSPPAEITPFTEGVWVVWWGEWPANQQFNVRVDVNATAHLALPGLEDDLAMGAGDWAQFTPRCQEYIPGLADVIAALEQQFVPYSIGGRYRTVELWQQWLSQNISWTSGSFDQQDARSVFTSRSGMCAGFANLFKAGLLEATGSYNVGVVYGWMLTGSTTYPDTLGNPAVILNGPMTAVSHNWSAVDDGSGWVPYEPQGGEEAFKALNNIHHGTYLDDSQGNTIAYRYHQGRQPTIQSSNTVTGSMGNAGTYVCKKIRAPFSTVTVSHWIASSDLKPSGPTSDAGDGPIVDRSQPHTFEITPIPATLQDWVQLHLFLSRNAVVDVQIYDVKGRKISQVPERQRRTVGHNWFIWEPGATPAGVYFMAVRLDDGETVEQLPAKKFTLIR